MAQTMLTVLTQIGDHVHRIAARRHNFDHNQTAGRPLHLSSVWRISLAKNGRCGGGRDLHSELADETMKTSTLWRALQSLLLLISESAGEFD